MTNAHSNANSNANSNETASGVYSTKIQEQIDQLFSTILTEQQKINKIKAADPDKVNFFKSKLDYYIKNRGREFFYNYISSGKGHGPFTELLDGSVKYDLINGIGFNLLGHSHPLMIKANLEAATVDTVMCGNLQTYVDANEASVALVNSVKEKSRLKHFWFTGSGGCANDLALKLIWQKKAPKYNLIAFKKAFAGRTIATQEITDKPDFREGMPKYLNVFHVPHFDQKNPTTSLYNTLSALDDLWERFPETFSAMMIELIQGEAGFIYGDKAFYEGIFKWAKEKGIYVWVDEVQTFGRTKELFAFQMFGLDQYVDMVTIAKAAHICGALYTEELNPKPGLIAGTFNGSISSIKMGSKIINYLLKGNFYGENGRIAELEKKFLNKMQKVQDSVGQDKLKFFSGIGTMISFEVRDGNKKVTTNFAKKLFENGVISFTAGQDPARIRFLLPLSLTDENIDEIFTILEKTFKEDLWN
ncbi:MAG: aminotransferase class III-fold pyridoxal phosphate-dependent enzyme [Oligoflexia bacterium]|nr:aminotransferase class III-fold pyridoxal phosphate-dependent enzyme [Oligoflexia bacterium]